MVAQVIQTDYDCLEDTAAEFVRHADCTVVLTFQAEQLCDRLVNGGWRGLGAQAFFAEMRELVFPALRRLQDGLQFAGEMTRRIRNVMQTHEEEAARLFRGEGEPLVLKRVLADNALKPVRQGGTPTPPPPLPLIPLTPIPDDYKYRNINNQEVSNPGIQQALDTLRRILDPNQFRGPNGELAWWHEDGQVTIDEILSLITFHEGKDVAEVRQAIYMRYLYYMGGDAEFGFSLVDQDSATEGFQNKNLDRFLRFLAYYEPWRDPGAVLGRSRVPFNVDFTPDTVHYPDGGTPSAPQPTPTSPPNTNAAASSILREVEAFLRDNRTQIPSGLDSSVAETIAGWQAGGSNSMNFFGNVPFHFANRNRDSWNDAIKSAIDSKNVGSGSNQLYLIGASGLIVLTPNQAVTLGNSQDGGVNLP